ESLRDFYLRFSLLLNDMNIYNMKLEQFQVNTKFLNTLPPEWSKFVTDVKLVRDQHTKNVDQLHAYLGQHEYHANEDNKNVNEILTAELERYKDQVRILKEQNNVDKASSLCAQSLETGNLKRTLFEHLKEKESLEQNVTLLKNDFQKEESQNIDRELAQEIWLRVQQMMKGSYIRIQEKKA
nr:hypothetical protein [Tanacetum cinerariifolium]